MSKLYTNKLNVNRPISKLILFSVLIFSSFNSYSQLIVPFTPRTSSVTPARTVYTVKGDFSMVGNTNLTSAVYSDTSANNNAMIYVDVDADNDTWNSSSSTLILPTENGSIPGCSNIIYAGLYWTGSAVGSGVEQYEFTTNIDGVPTTIDKRNIKFKPPNATDYIDVTANDDDIYFPAPGVFSNIYSAYAEVTDLIDPADFLGEYFVADLPSAEGILPPAGYHGGWGMVVVYENSLMDWRDITVFDGHAHVSGEIADYTFDVNGFNTAQSGDVAVKLGIMAAEGDVNLSGDYFEILRQDNNTFQRLSHSTNTTNNFFNSSINVGNDGPRNPNLNNNTGLDIAMFNIDNTGNGIITNNQTSTTFRYGTTSDRFVIYNVTFSVNSYVPEVTGVITNTSINGIPNPTPITIEPGQAALYELEIKNIGTEATNNTVVTIPLPDTVNPNNLNIIFNTFYSPLSPDYIDPQYDGSIGTNGAIVWNLGTLPLPIDADDVLAEISFELTATTNCAILGDINNTPSITLFGNISGVGAVSNVPFDTPLIQGFSVDDICKDNPIPIPIIIPIDYLAFINEGPTITCPTDIIQSADTGESGAIVTYTEPVGTDNAPGAITTRIAGPGPGDLFPIGTTTVTYQVIDDCGIIATCSFTVTVTDDEDPTITCPPSVNITADAGQNGAIVTYADPVISDNTPGATFALTAGLPSGSLFPIGVTTNTFVVTDANGNTATCSFTVTVTDDEDPTITCPPSVNITADAGQNGAIVTYADPVISDNTPGATFALTAGLPSGSLFPVGVTTNTFVVTDANGNTATCSFTVTVTDDEDPTITCPPSVNITADAGQNGAIVTYADPVISDNAPGATFALTAGLPSGSLFPVGVTTNTFEVTDANGNTATCSFTVTVTDDEDPTITCPPVVNITADAGQNGAIVTYADPVISDNAPGATFALTAGLPSGSLFPVGVTTNTFVVTDANGNTATCSFTVTVTDDEDPTITCPPVVNITADAGQNGAIVTYADPVISDNAPGATFALTAGLPSGSLFPVGVTTNTFVVTDANGNTATCSFTVTVTDDEDPTITCPPSVNITADAGQNGAIVTYADPVISDNAPGATFALTAGLPSGSLFPVGVTTNTFVVTDANGNTATCSFTVTVTDDEDPSISCPPVVNITADAGQNGAIVTYADPVISDNAPGATFALTAGLPSGSLFPVGVTTNTFVVTDASGNTATCSFTVTVTDDEDPTITCPPSVNITADAGQNGAIVTYADPVISDNAPGATFALTAGLPSGSLFPVGVTTNTFVVTDANGNTATCSFTVTVTDDEDPTITCPPSVNITADAGQNGAIVTYADPVISDNAPGATFALTAGLPSGSLFPVGVTTNTFVVTDASGNTATCSFTVTVTDDENPSITCPGDINQNVDIGLCGAVIIYTNPVGTDNAPGAVTIQTAGLPSGSEFPVGITTNTFEVTDANGNTATCSFTVTVIDNEPPVIVCPADISQTADSDQCVSTITIVEPTATDNCSTVFVFEGIRSDNLALSDPYPVGSTTITWTATDEANNTSLGCIQTINITDDEAPDFLETLPVDVVVECDQVPVAAILTATDNCNTANVTFNEVRTDGSCVSDYILERTWIATDDNGNTTTHVQIITVEDNTPPVLSLPANVTAECSDDLSPIAFGRATATDNCDASPVITFSDATMSGACSGTFTITRTWTATDACGNISTADQIISTSDTTAPEFVEDLPQNLTIECNSVPTAETITATDNCGTAEVTVNDTRTDGNCPNNYIITRIYTATDECGLTNTHIQTITVVDITPPVFVEALPTANLVVECDSVPTPETLTATDTCGSASVSVADVITNGNCDNNYTIARTWTATDECGLTTTHTQIIVVQDTTPPVFVEALPADILVECDAIPTAENITATDNCGDATVAVTDVRTDGDCPSNYIISRTWTATDECGLTTEHTQNITVQDTTAPIPTSTFDQTLNVSCADVPDAPQLEFTDNCSTNVIVVFNETNSFDENVLVDYEIVRTWTVRDACNNEAVYTQTLFVTLDEVITDVTAPDRCFDDGIVNLNDFIGDLNTNGVWEIIEGDTAAIVTGSIFDPSGLELSETFLPEDGGIDYKFRYTTTDAGCISITELIMNVNADCVVLPCGENDVVVSKAVTPNGDQFNEFFEVSGVELCGFQYEVKIFNRWGSLIYESDNYQNDWNGKAMRSIGAASNVPNGTYYYIVILKNSGLNPITGPVYLGTK